MFVLHRGMMHGVPNSALPGMFSWQLQVKLDPERRSRHGLVPRR